MMFHAVSLVIQQVSQTQCYLSCYQLPSMRALKLSWSVSKQLAQTEFVPADRAGFGVDDPKALITV